MTQDSLGTALGMPLSPSKTVFQLVDLSDAEITGYDQLSLSDFKAIVITSDLRRTGTFNCSHASINRFHENTVWSTRGNFVSVPTDCPQRDERLGWIGDI